MISQTGIERNRDGRSRSGLKSGRREGRGPKRRRSCSVLLASILISSTILPSHGGGLAPACGNGADPADEWTIQVERATGVWSLRAGDRVVISGATARYVDGDSVHRLGPVQVEEKTEDGLRGRERRWRLRGKRMVLDIAIDEEAVSSDRTDPPVVRLSAMVLQAEKLRRVETLTWATPLGGVELPAAAHARALVLGFDASEPPRLVPVGDKGSVNGWWMTAIGYADRPGGLVVGFVPGMRSGFDTLTIQKQANRATLSTSTWFSDVAVDSPRACASVLVAPTRSVVDALGHYAASSARLAGVKLPKRALTAWGPTGALGHRYTHADIDRHANIVRRDFFSFGVGVVRLDDGYQRSHRRKIGGGLGDWLASDRRFTAGFAGLVKSVRDRGLEAGVWLAPFLVGKSSEPFRETGGFLLAGPDGLPLPIDRGPLATGWRGDPVYSIDAAEDDAQSWLHHIGRELAARGITHVRAAFLGDGMRPGRRAGGMPAADAFRKGLESFRAGLGSRCFLSAEDAPFAPLCGIADAVRVTPRSVIRGWPELLAAVRAISYRYFLHGEWWYADAGDLRIAPSVLGDVEARAALSFLAMTVGLSGLGDDLQRLPLARRELLKRALPMVPGRVRPLDLFAADGPPSVWDMRVDRAGERWNVVGFFNWTERPRVYRIPIAELQGLDAVKAALVYDYWRDRFVGVREGTIEVLVPPHDCRIYQVRRHTAAPQLLSVTRHITGGAASLRGVSLRRRTDGRQLVVKTDLIPTEPIGVRIYSPWAEVVDAKYAEPWQGSTELGHPDGTILRADATPLGRTFGQVAFALPGGALPSWTPPSIRGVGSERGGDLRVVVLPPELIRTGGAAAWIQEMTGEPGALVGTWGRKVTTAPGMDVAPPRDVAMDGPVWLSHPSLGRECFAIRAGTVDGGRIARAIYLPGEPAIIIAVGDPRVDPGRWLARWRGRRADIDRAVRAWVGGTVAAEDRSGPIDRVDRVGAKPLDIGDTASEAHHHYEATIRADVVRSTIHSRDRGLLADIGRRITDSESFSLPPDPAQRGWTILRRTAPEDRGKRLLVLVGGAGDAREWKLGGEATGEWPIDRFELPPIPANGVEPVRVTLLGVDGAAYLSLRYRFYLRPNARRVGIASIKPLQAVQQSGRPRADRAVSGGPMMIGDRLYLRGLGVHAPSRITLPIPSRIERFEAKVGIDRGVGQRGGVIFVVELDGEVAFRSKKCYGGQPAIPISIETGDATTIRLIVEPAGEARYDHANWADAAFVKRDRARMPER